MSLDPELRRRLTIRRIADGLTQRDLAARMGAGQATISYLENGLVDPLLSTLEKWANALGQQLVITVQDGAE